MRLTGTNSPDAKRLVSILETLAREFIRYPDAAHISVLELQHKINIAIRPHADDYGKLIGTGGIMFKAMETILQTAGFSRWNDIKYAILQPIDGQEEAKPKYKRDPAWTSERVVKTLLAVMGLIDDNRRWEVSAIDTDEVTGLQVVAEMPLPGKLDHLSDALSIVFLAIGKAQGRNEILVEVIAKEKANDRSPINRR